MLKATRAHAVPFSDGRPGPVSDTNDQPELKLPTRPDAPFPPDDNYRDPVAHDHPDYAGRWLTGSARVGNTEMVVVVQQKDESAVAPQAAFFQRFAAWAGGVAVSALLLFVALSVVRVQRAGTGARGKT